MISVSTPRSDVFVYLENLGGLAHEIVMAGADGYTVYIEASLSPEKMHEAYEHAVSHIDAGHWDFDGARTATELEYEAHTK